MEVKELTEKLERKINLKHYKLLNCCERIIIADNYDEILKDFVETAQSIKFLKEQVLFINNIK